MLVSNTSTLVLLAKIRCLEAFIEVAPLIEIPSQVKKEALFEENSYYARFIGKLIADKKIKVVDVDNGMISNIMSKFSLNLGEAAAFAMFDSKKHNAVLTDDGELIKLCKLEKAPFLCAMAIIIRLFEKNKLSKELSLEKLEELHKIGRYSVKLYEHFRKEVN